MKTKVQGPLAEAYADLRDWARKLDAKTRLERREGPVKYLRLQRFERVNKVGKASGFLRGALLKDAECRWGVSLKRWDAETSLETKSYELVDEALEDLKRWIAGEPEGAAAAPLSQASKNKGKA